VGRVVRCESLRRGLVSWIELPVLELWCMLGTDTGTDYTGLVVPAVW
jgi:hypothetical protein